MNSNSGKKIKVLVLFSGGLDSLIVVKLLIMRGFNVEAVHFKTPFSNANEKLLIDFCENEGIKLHDVYLEKEFLDIVKPFDRLFCQALIFVSIIYSQ